MCIKYYWTKNLLEYKINILLLYYNNIDFN